jgi:RNA polymerase sigma factor (sigma-70 family)
METLTRVEEIRKFLERKFDSYDLDGYVKIACGEALTKLWEREKSLGYELSDTKRKSFLFVAARNILRNERKRQDHLKHLGDVANHFKNEASLVEMKFEEDEINKLAASQALALLSNKRREVLAMKYLEGYTEKEIAKKLVIAVSSVEDRLKGAKKELKKKLSIKKNFNMDPPENSCLNCIT